MPNLQTTLREHESGLIPTLAQLWGIKAKNLAPDKLLEVLREAMLNPQQAEKVWDMLNDAERGALLSVISQKNHTMPLTMFERLYGKINKMGQGAIEREQPHKNPTTVADGLFYRGFISTGFENAKSGAKPVVYVPSDMVEILPVHKTQYVGLESEPLPPQPEMVIRQLDTVEDEYLENVQQADTSIVDDMTSLLAYLRIQGAGVEDNVFLPVDVERVHPFMLRKGDIRMNFMLGVGVSASLITSQEGRAYPKRAELQKWLGLPRSQQLRELLTAWKSSTVYHDLWHVPGLYPDPDAGFPYDPLVGREAMVEFLRKLAPPQEWWSIDEFIQAIKEIEPDFQRPGGNYDSWYIRNDRSEYLHGFESWDAVEGSLLEFYIKGPLHWLGLMDIAEDAAKLTAYGRSFIGLIDWPTPPEPSDTVTIQADGMLHVSRKVSRVDRFQVARFSTWMESDEPYVYRLDGDSMQMAAAQGITTQHIASFLKRQNDDKPLPAMIAKLLDTWQTGATSEVTFERLLVLRTNSPEVMEKVYNEPALRRYLGARLGPMACVIRNGQEADLQVALGESGIKVEIVG
jgi:hypothetical protein